MSSRSITKFFNKLLGECLCDNPHTFLCFSLAAKDHAVGCLAVNNCVRHNAINDALNKRNMTGETGELCEIPKSVDNPLDKKLGTMIHGFRVVLPVRNDQNHVANHLKGSGLFWLFVCVQG